MKTKMISWSVALAFLAVGTVSAYHIPEQDDTSAPGYDARNWSVGIPGLVVCESMGPNDPVNDNPIVNPGVNGNCYAASQDFWDENELKWDEEAKKEKKVSDAENQTVWSYFRPVCFDADGDPCDPALLDKWTTPDWFIRVGSNAHSCNGVWGQEFRYKELLAYYHGSQPNEHGASGHVTFFVNEGAILGGAVNGTYHNGKGAEAPDIKGDAKHPNDPDGLLFGSLCSSSNFVGLGDCDQDEVTDFKDGEAKYTSDGVSCFLA